MWLVVGGDSEIGAALYRRLTEAGIPAMATTRRSGVASLQRSFLDLTVPLDDWEPPEGTTAACIAAAVARLADCATDPIGSAAVNVTGTLTLAARLIARDVHVLFLSSNQVFDGSRPYVPADAPTCPVSEYGRQKAITESALKVHMERGSSVAILRLAKVLSPAMPLLAGWVEALAAGRRVRAFEDMRMAPTPIDIVVDAIVALMRDRTRGIFQLSGLRDATYADVARYLAAKVGVDSALVRPMSASAGGVLPTGATPLHTTLDSTGLSRAYGITVPDVWSVLDGLLGSEHRRRSRN